MLIWMTSKKQKLNAKRLSQIEYETASTLHALIHIKTQVLHINCILLTPHTEPALSDTHLRDDKCLPDGQPVGSAGAGCAHCGPTKLRQ